MTEAERMVLSDAIQTAVEAEREVIVLKKMLGIITSAYVLTLAAIFTAFWVQYVR